MGTDLKMTPENLEKVCILSSMGLTLLKEDNEPLLDDLYLIICWKSSFVSYLGNIITPP